MASLSSIRMPKDAGPVLARIVELDGNQIDVLVGAVSSSNIRDMAGLKDAVASAVGSGWTSDDIDAFISHLMSMVALGASHGFDAQTLAASITHKIAGNLPEGSEEILRPRLAELLDARGLVAFSKAVDVTTEYDQLLHLSRIITDIRPVFGPDAAADPLGAVITHTLRLDYFHEGRMKTTSFALNVHDLADLRAAVDRAEDKQQSLSRALQQLTLTEFDMTDEQDHGR